MMNDKLADLSPRHAMSLDQGLLFKMTLEELEATTEVSAKEMLQWHERGLLSFGPHEEVDFDDRHRVEVEFIAGLVRSGLTAAWIDKVLSHLPKPYCYDSARTFYSFAHKTWITLPEIPDPEEVVKQYLIDLAEDEEWETLENLKGRILELLPQEV
jgi:hypothetical protein